MHYDNMNMSQYSVYSLENLSSNYSFSPFLFIFKSKYTLPNINLSPDFIVLLKKSQNRSIYNQINTNVSKIRLFNYFVIAYAIARFKEMNCLRAWTRLSRFSVSASFMYPAFVRATAIQGCNVSLFYCPHLETGVITS